MALINGEIRHPEFDIEIDILQYTKDETPSNRKAIVDLNLGFEFPGAVTPDELYEIGQWLVEQSGIIKKDYTANGKPKYSNNQNK